jgi:hypothetical protein
MEKVIERTQSTVVTKELTPPNTTKQELNRKFVSLVKGFKSFEKKFITMKFEEGGSYNIDLEGYSEMNDFFEENRMYLNPCYDDLLDEWKEFSALLARFMTVSFRDYKKIENEELRGILIIKINNIDGLIAKIIKDLGKKN